MDFIFSAIIDKMKFRNCNISLCNTATKLLGQPYYYFLVYDSLSSRLMSNMVVFTILHFSSI